MKFRKLIIHNLASIADATIDFDQQPLSDADVFLITGNTGSGKSTILDAICLALYSDTPRFDNTKMQGSLDDVTLKDARQLLSKGEGECSATLYFKGNNGVEYKAVWSVRRARDRADGKLQQKSWLLVNLNTNKNFTKDKEIKEEIAKAIGLDFQQFCRTTMLAQGAFTKFLDSTDDEKATILEKITGIDDYTKIGTMVYQVTSEKEKKWEDAKLLLDNTVLLSEEDRCKIQEELETIQKSIDDLSGQMACQSKKRAWLEAEKNLETMTQSANAKLQSAEAAIRTEAFQQMEKLVKSWNETITIRQELRKRNEAQKSIQEQNTALEKGKNGFMTLLSGQLFLQEELDKCRAEAMRLETFLDNNLNRKSVFENAQTIAGELKTMIDGNTAIAKENSDIAAANAQLNGTLKTAVEVAQKVQADKNRALVSEQQKLQEKERALQGFGLPNLRDSRDKVTREIHELELLTTKVQTVFKEQERRAQASRKLADQEKRMSDLDGQLKNELAPKLHDAEVIYNTRKQDYEKQYESASDWARKMRAQLHVGEMCPVCGQPVSQELPHEEDVAKLVQDLKAALDTAEQAWKTLDGQKTQCEAELKGIKTLYDADKKIFDADKTLEEVMNDALQSGASFGITTMDDNSLKYMDNEMGKRNENLAALNGSIQKAETVEKEVGDLRKTCETLSKELEAAKGNVDAVQKEMEKCRAAIDASNKVLDIKKAEVAKAECAVAQYLGTTVWDADWKTETAQFAGELSGKAKAYADNDTLYQTTTRRVENTEKECEAVANAAKEIVQLFPNWANLKSPEAQSVENIVEKFGKLLVWVSNAKTRKSDAEKALDVAESTLGQWLNAHDGFQLEDLSRLDAFDQGAIEEKNRQLQDGHKQVDACKAALQQIGQQKETHIAEKPDLEANDTLDSMDESLENLNQQKEELSTRKGSNEEKLRQDEENKNRQQELRTTASNLESEYRRWDKLNSLIGSSDGRRFRKVAQSYILAGLVDSANTYMKTLTDRYTLLVAPGTFIITLEDAYQGFARRSASTISGGETFLVSLSLALALSDFGQNLSVDTLFIDEGFGTLSGEPLQKAIATLRSLHNSSGRNVGIISHIDELQYSVPVQIKVKQNGNSGYSTVEIVG